MLLEILEVSIASDFCDLFTSLRIFVTLYDFHELDDFMIFVNFVYLFALLRFLKSAFL